MFSHVTIGTNDWDHAKPFWIAVMREIGQPMVFEYPGGAAFGTADGPKTFVGSPFDGQPARAGNGIHIAYAVGSRAQVDAFYRTALDHGGSDEGAPGLRPHYHPHYYAAYVRDPDGNKIQAVCHLPCADAD